MALILPTAVGASFVAGWAPTWIWPQTAIYIGAAILIALVARWLVNRGIDHAVAEAQNRAGRRRRGLGARAERVLAGATGYDTERHAARTAAMGSLLRSLSTVLITSLGLLYVMDALGLNLAPVLASAGIGGVALGFGAQSLVKDFLSGVFMILEDQYGVGDIVDTGEVTGTVEEVTLRITRLRDASGVVWYVRNGEIIRVANKSQGWSTAVVDLPVAATERPERVIEVLREVISRLDADPEWEGKLLEPPQVVGLESVDGPAMTIRVTAKCAPNEHWGVQRAIRERAMGAFHHAGIAPPPLPQSPGSSGATS